MSRSTSALSAWANEHPTLCALAYSPVTFLLVYIPCSVTEWVGLLAGLVAAVASFLKIAPHRDWEAARAEAFGVWRSTCRVVPWVALPSLLLRSSRDYSGLEGELMLTLGLAGLYVFLVVGVSWALGNIFGALEDAARRGLASRELYGE